MGVARVTTWPGERPQSPPAPGVDTRRRFRATLPSPLGTRFDVRTAALFDGLVIVLVDGDGAPARGGKGIAVTDIRAVFKTPPLLTEDSVFAYVEDVELRGDGEAVRFVFEPVGNSNGAVSGVFRDLLEGVGVSEVVDLVRLEGRA
ncbi:hypothetical protein LCGC14_0443740 [marine sediment metagenome]|uniref:Uncharacterized protein n=1 Tax=marine sediment metagenome TaxID=412755 RepID=A0A0F9VTV5_9ZZZZ